MPAQLKMVVVFITVVNRVCRNSPAHVPTGSDPGQTKLSRVLPAHQPTAVTELASLGGVPITEALAVARAGYCSGGN